MSFLYILYIYIKGVDPGVLPMLFSLALTLVCRCGALSHGVGKSRYPLNWRSRRTTASNLPTTRIRATRKGARPVRPVPRDGRNTRQPKKSRYAVSSRCLACAACHAPFWRNNTTKVSRAITQAWTLTGAPEKHGCATERDGNRAVSGTRIAAAATLGCPDSVVVQVMRITTRKGLSQTRQKHASRDGRPIPKAIVITTCLGPEGTLFRFSYHPKMAGRPRKARKKNTGEGSQLSPPPWCLQKELAHSRGQ